MFLTSTNRRTEDVVVLPIIVPELKRHNIQRKVLGRDLMKVADDATLDQRPEAFDRLSVDCADDVLAFAMIDALVRELAVQPEVAAELVSAKKGNASPSYSRLG
jgi:hypothetical protein